MNWKSLITQLATRSGRKVSFREPVAAKELDALEREFRLQLPADYRALMLESGGVFDEYNCAIIDSVDSVLRINREARGDCYRFYMPLDHLFFVSSAFGNGDLLGYGFRRDGWETPSLYRWDHENDSRTWEAPDLKSWLDAGYGDRERHSRAAVTPRVNFPAATAIRA